jgi:hypothetical protein
VYDIVPSHDGASDKLAHEEVDYEFIEFNQLHHAIYSASDGFDSTYQ